MSKKKQNEPVECGDFEVIASTFAALLVSDCCGTQAWIPKSQICDESDLAADSERGDEGVLMIPEWLAIEKGLV